MSIFPSQPGSTASSQPTLHNQSQPQSPHSLSQCLLIHVLVSLHTGLGMLSISFCEFFKIGIIIHRFSMIFLFCLLLARHTPFTLAITKTFSCFCKSRKLHLPQQHIIINCISVHFEKWGYYLSSPWKPDLAVCDLEAPTNRRTVWTSC